MRGKKHGMCDTRLYETWKTMKKMCYVPKHISYKMYGGRGITVCDEWKNSFEEFYAWATENGYQEGMKLIRKDVDGNYEPSNCEWNTERQVCRTSNCYKRPKIEYKGETHTVSEWSKITGISAKTIWWRINTGWSVEDALTTKAIMGANNKANQYYVTFNGETKCISEWARITGINRGTLLARIRYGWSVERTLTTKARSYRRKSDGK